MSETKAKTEEKRAWLKDLKPADLLLFAGSIILSLAIVYIYMSKENALYWCDFNYYHIMAVAASRQLLENPVAFPLLVMASTALNYNLLYTVPVLPAILLLGDGRECFIAAITLIYQLPFVLLLAGNAALIVNEPEEPLNRRMIFWLTVFLSLSCATIWAPTLRGYPDFGPASLVLLASLVYLNDRKLKSWKNLIAIGLLLAAAPLIRRHFFYLSFAQAGAMLIHQLYLKNLNNESWSTFFKESFTRWALVGLTSAVFLSTVGFLFINTILSNPYFSLYKSAYVSVFEGISYEIHSYGVIAFASALAGFSLALKHKILNREKTCFLLCFAILAFLIWPLFGKHIAIHYTIYSDTFVILGNLSLFLWLARLNPIRLRSYACAIAVFFWSFNFVLGLSDHKESYMTQTKYGMLTVALSKPDFYGRLVSANFSPLKRDDHSELERLYEFLAELSDGKKNVFIASDNGVLGADIFRNLERQKTGEFKAEAIKFIEPPILDSRDALAVEALIMSDFVVIPRPFLPMYEPEDSRDLEVVLEAFSKDWEIAGDFKKMESEFHLDRNTTVAVYKRLKPTTAGTAAITYDRMKDYVGVELAGQPAWITTNGKYIAHDQQNKNKYLVAVNGINQKTNFLLSSALHKGRLKLSGYVSEPESQANKDQQTNRSYTLSVEALDKSGVINSAATRIKSGGTFNLTLDLDKAKPCHLALFIENTGVNAENTTDKRASSQEYLVEVNKLLVESRD